MSMNVTLRLIMDANKLTNAHFMDRLKNLRIVPKVYRITYVLDGPLLESPTVDASDDDHKAFKNHLDDNVIATCTMLGSTSPEL